MPIRVTDKSEFQPVGVPIEDESEFQPIGTPVEDESEFQPIGDDVGFWGEARRSLARGSGEEVRDATTGLAQLGTAATAETARQAELLRTDVPNVTPERYVSALYDTQGDVGGIPSMPDPSSRLGQVVPARKQELEQELADYSAQRMVQEQNAQELVDRSGLTAAVEKTAEIDEAFGEKIEEWFPKTTEYEGRYVISDPSVLLEPKWWAANGFEMIPQTVAMLSGAGLTGAITKSKRAASAVAGAVAGHQEAMSVYRQAQQEGMDLEDSLLKYGEAFAGGTALNALGANFILSRLPKNLLAKMASTVVRGGVEGLTESSEEVFQGYIMGEPLKNLIIQAVEVFPVAALMGMVGSSVSEMAQSGYEGRQPPPGGGPDQPGGLRTPEMEARFGPEATSEAAGATIPSEQGDLSTEDPFVQPAPPPAAGPLIEAGPDGAFIGGLAPTDVPSFSRPSGSGRTSLDKIDQEALEQTLGDLEDTEIGSDFSDEEAVRVADSLGLTEQAISDALTALEQPVQKEVTETPAPAESTTVDTLDALDRLIETADAQRIEPDEVVKQPIGEAFDRFDSLDAEAQQRSTLLDVEGFGNLTLRRGPAAGVEDVIQIVNVSAEEKGQGTFDGLLAELKSRYPSVPIYAESVLTERFRGGLQRRGFQDVGGNNFLWTPEQEAQDKVAANRPTEENVVLMDYMVEQYLEAEQDDREDAEQLWSELESLAGPWGLGAADLLERWEETQSVAGLFAQPEMAAKVETAPSSKQPEAAQQENAAPTEETPAAPEIAPQAAPAKAALPDIEGLEVAGDVYRMPVDQIALDPERFQFKIDNLGQEGQTATLIDVKQWDEKAAGTILAWRDPENDKVYVTNGHNRVGLAKRLGVEKMKVEFSEAPTAEEARAEAALMNIREGKGTAIDAAKFIRDTEIKPDDMQRLGISLSDAKMRDAQGLAKLNPLLFDEVVQSGRQKDVTVGAIVGSTIPDMAQQADFMAELAKEEERRKRDFTIEEVRETADRFVNTERVGEETDLFGENIGGRSTLFAEGEVTASIKQRLSKEKRLFGTVVRGKEQLEEAGNVIAEEASKQVSQAAAQNLAVFDTLKHTGEIGSIIRDAARRLAEGKTNAKQVKKEAYDAVLAAIPGLISRRNQPTGTGNAAVREEGTGSARTETQGGERQDELFWRRVIPSEERVAEAKRRIKRDWNRLGVIGITPEENIRTQMSLIRETGVLIVHYAAKGVTRMSKVEKHVKHLVERKLGRRLTDKEFKPYFREARKMVQPVITNIRKRQRADTPKRRINKQIVKPESEQVLVDARDMLRYSIKMQAKAGRAGERIGHREGTLSTRATLKEVLQFAKDYLGPGHQDMVAKIAQRIINSAPKTQEAALRYVRRAVQKMVEKQEMADAIAGFKDVVRKARKRKLRREYRAQLDALLEQMAVTTRRDAILKRMNDTLKAAKREVDARELPGQIPEKARANAERTIKDANERQRKMLEDLGGEARRILGDTDRARLQDFDATAIRDLTDIVKQIVHQSTTKQNLIYHRQQKRRDQVEAEAAAEVRDRMNIPDDLPPGERKARRHAVSATIGWMTRGQASIQNLVLWMANEGGQAWDVLVTQIQQAQSEFEALRFRAKDHINAVLDDIGLTKEQRAEMSDILSGYTAQDPVSGKLLKRVKEPVVHNITLPSGQTLRMTAGERISFYLAWMNASTRAELLKDKGEGFVLSVDPRAERFKVDIETADAILATVTDTEKRIGDAIRAYLNGDLRSRLSDWWNDRYGHDIFGEEDYWPRRRLRDPELDDMKIIQGTKAEHQSIFKPRTTGSAPIVVGDAFAEFFAHVNRTALLLAKANPTRDALMLLKNENEFTDTVKRASKSGEELLKTLADRIEKFGRIKVKRMPYWDRMVRGFIRNSTVANLALNAPVIASQWVSVWSAQADIGVGHLNYGLKQAFRPGGFRSTEAAIAQYAPQLRAVVEGGGHQVVTPEQMGGTVQTFYGMAPTSDRYMGLLAKSNEIAVVAIWHAAMREGQQIGLQGDALMEYVGTRATEVYNRSQPNFDVTATAGMKLAARDSSLVALATMYTGQTQVMMQQMIRASVQYARGDIGKAKLVKDITIPTLFQGAIFYGMKVVWEEGKNALFGMDDDRDAMEKWADYIADVIGGLFGIVLGAGPFLDSMTETAKKILMQESFTPWEFTGGSNPITTLGIDAYQSVALTAEAIADAARWQATAKQAYTAVDSIVDAVGQIAGLPLRHPKDDILKPLVQMLTEGGEPVDNLRPARGGGLRGRGLRPRGVLK